MAITFIEAGSDATGGLEFYTSSGGFTPTSSSTFANTGTRSIRCQGNGKSFVQKNDILAKAGRRIQKYFRLTNLPLNQTVLLEAIGDNSEVYSVRVTPGGVIQLFANGIQVGSDGATVTTGVWYRLTLAYAITSLTVNSAKCWIDGANLITATDVTLGADTPNHLRLGFITNPGLTSTQYLYFDDVYVDDSTAVTDPLAINVTNKKPNALSTNNFDTVVGATPTNRWDNVSEFPANLSNGFKHIATTDVTESFGVQAVNAGDEDITGLTVLGRAAWILSKRGIEDGAFTQILGHNNSKSTGSSLTITNSELPTTGTIIVAIAMDNDANNEGSIITVTDSVNNVYLLAAQKSGLGFPETSIRTLIFYCRNATSLPVNGTIIIDFPSIKNKVAIAVEFGGIQATPLDKTSSGITTTVSPSSGATATTTQAAEIIFGAIGFKGNFKDFKIPGVTYQNLLIAGNDNIGLEIQYKQQSSTAAQTVIGTLDNAHNATSLVATFKSTGVTSGSPEIINNGTPTAITLTTSPFIHTNIVTNATYPTEIGMTSSNGTPDTFLYECGFLVAFVP